SIEEVRAELVDRYGPLPEQAETLLAVAGFRVHARTFGITGVSAQGRQIRFAPLDLRESQTLRLQRLYKGALVKPATSTVLVPAPSTTGRLGAPPLGDRALLSWARTLLDEVVGAGPGAGTSTSTATVAS